MDRMTGTITKVFPDKGFAFLRGEDHFQRLVHASEVKPISDFDMLAPGTRVTFVPWGEVNLDPAAKNNGLKAKSVRVER